MKVLVFDIYGDLAHFRKFYTTSSPLTFPFPPPSTIKGMLGAIIGVDKKDYLRVFSSDHCKIGFQILRPVKKIRLGLNHINTKQNYWIPTKRGSHEARTQIRTEFIKDPGYRLYVSHEDRVIFEDLVEKVKNHEAVFTPALGLSELLADFQYQKVVEVEESKEGETDLVTVIPLPYLEGLRIIFEGGKKYFKERIPIRMNEERIVEEYQEVIFESGGKTIQAETKRHWKSESGESLLFF
ncbi:MAG: type I-B CRISPR-associated protein Cas5b [Atribacterota bacterium]|jgi:CRISPR-associated protein Cas5h|nr:type I-B CRISPR-associated protein Cas5b [Atribacterota bacterium]